MAKMRRRVRITQHGWPRAHLVIAYHGDQTVTTLCGEPHKRFWYAEDTRTLCDHCLNVLDDLNAEVDRAPARSPYRVR